MYRSVSFAILLLGVALTLTACSDDSSGPNANADTDATGDLETDPLVDPDTSEEVDATPDSADDPADETPDVEPSDTAADTRVDATDDGLPEAGDDAVVDADTTDSDADLLDPDTTADADADDLLDPDTADLADTTDLTDTGGSDLTDTGEPEVPRPGFGTIGGECGILDDDEWSSTSVSFFFVNTLDFETNAYDAADLSQLTTGGQEIIADGNLNAGSLLSEVFAYEMLDRCELASLIATETEITYTDPDGPKTDVLVTLDGRIIGVSVTRAHPLDNPFDAARARALLEDKLQGILDSTANVMGEHVWERQILHVIAADAARVTALEAAYEALVSDDSPVLSDTIIVVTRTDGEDEPLYCTTSCPSP